MHPLQDLIVFDPDGRSVRLGDTWAERTAALVFVRHFGCLFCRQQIGELAPFLPRIRQAGAELFVIGNGSIDEARAFRDDQQLAMPLLTDPTRAAYGALDMRRGLGSMLRLPVFARSLGALRGGFRQARVAGDWRQQGGVVVIAPGGVERYRYVSRFAGDHPSPEVIVEAGLNAVT